jgi:hypothetical protein
MMHKGDEQSKPRTDAGFLRTCGADSGVGRIQLGSAGQCCFFPWRLKPFCPIGAAAGVAACCGWGCFWVLAQQAVDLQSLPEVGVGVAGEGTFAVSLMFLSLLFVGVIQRGRTLLSQETCQPDAWRDMKCNSLCRSGLRRSRSPAIPLRDFATWTFSKVFCEFSFFGPQF